LFFFPLFFQSDNISSIYHWTKMYIKSINQSNCIYHSERKKKKSRVFVWRRRTSFLLLLFFLSHECIYLISWYIAMEKKKRRPEHIHTYTKHKLPCTPSQEKEKEVGNRRKNLDGCISCQKNLALLPYFFRLSFWSYIEKDAVVIYSNGRRV